MCNSQWKPQSPSNTVSTITNQITFLAIHGSEDNSQAAPVTVSSPHGGSFHVIKNSGPMVMLHVRITFCKLHGFYVSQHHGSAHICTLYNTTTTVTQTHAHMHKCANTHTHRNTYTHTNSHAQMPILSHTETKIDDEHWSVRASGQCS